MNALKHHNFRLFLISSTISYLGTWVERLALSWLAWESSGSAFWTGLVAIGALLPSGLLGPLFGAMAERWEMRTAAVKVNSALALISLFLFISVIAFQPPVQFLAGVSLMIGIASAINHPVRMVIVSQIVPPEALSSAVRWNATAFNLSRVLGPAFAGFFIATVGPKISLIFNPLSFIPLICVLRWIQLFPQRSGTVRSQSLSRDMFEGVTYLLQDRIVLWILMVTAVNAIAIRGTLEITPVVVGDLLHGDSNMLALMTAAAGIGSVMAALTAAMVVPSNASAGRIAVLAAIPGALCISMIGLNPSTSLSALLIGGAGFFTTISAVNSQSIVYNCAALDFRARSLTWWSTLSIGASSFGGMAISALAEFSPLANALISIGILGASIAVILTFFAPAKQRYLEAMQ